MKIPVIYLTAFLLLILIGASGLRAEADRIRILGIGNSFTENAMRYLPAIIRSDPEVQADVAVAGIGGSSLDLHVELAQAHEADADGGKRYKYLYNLQLRDEAAALKTILLDEDWDYITIQQVSHQSYKPETYEPYAADLVEYIRRYVPDAEIVFHETWSHSIDSYRFKDWKLHPDEMYSKLHDAYSRYAEQLGLRVIPVGAAFQRAKTDPLWDYQPTGIDTSQLVYPDDRDNLPDMSHSLHKVFYWHEDRETGDWRLVNDGFHANANGQYLGGLVWYAFFFDRDPRDIDFAPSEMSSEQAVSLRKLAFAVTSEE